MKNILPAILVFAILVPSDNLEAQLGAPTVWGLLGQSIAQGYVQDELLRTSREFVDADASHSKGLKKYERGLKRLKKKHARLRAKEERILRSMINDMARYDPLDRNINLTQDLKMKKIFDTAQGYKANDQDRKNEIVAYRARNYPKRSIIIL